MALRPQLQVQDPQGKTVTVAGKPLTVAPGANALLSLPYETALPGRYYLQLTLGPGLRTRLAADRSVCVLDVSHYGEALPSPDKQVGLWWATSGWKVSRTRPTPTTKGAAAIVRLARNETEGAQLVVRPDRPLRGLTGKVSPLRNAAGAALPAAAVELLAVDYVNVEYASDEIDQRQARLRVCHDEPPAGGRVQP